LAFRRAGPVEAIGEFLSPTKEAIKMVRAFFDTKQETTQLILRLMLGIVFLPHGAQKLLGWFGGNGFSGTMEFFTGSMGIPAVLAFLVIMTESFGSLALITGFFTRLAAFGVSCIMVVATYLIHWQNGFFMNWFGKQAGEGFEYHILAVAICLALMIKGGGRWSVDGWIARRMG